MIIAIIFNFYKNFDRIYESGFINEPKKMISFKINKPNKNKLGDFIYYDGWYGNAPIGNKVLENKIYKRKFIFNIISNK